MRVAVAALLLVPHACSSLQITQRFRARLRYDGTLFHGVQKNVRPTDGTELRTILSTLEQSLWPALQQPWVAFRVAGRTDAGVSATGQVVTFDAFGDEEARLKVHGQPVDCAALAEALNACLPTDLQITEVDVVPLDFDVVRDCRWKRYRYSLPPCRPDADDDEALRLLNMVRTHAERGAQHRREAGAAGDAEGTPRDGAGAGAGAPAAGKRKRRRRSKSERLAALESSPPLAICDVAAMRRAASLLEGTHDFAAFQASRGDQKGSVRTLFRCALERRRDAHGGAAEAEAEGRESDGTGEEGESYDIVVEGDGFLYKQVRILAGTLAMVGMGLAPPETVLTALASDADAGAAEGGNGVPKAELRRRGVVGPTLPPERLRLEHVEYDREHDSKRQEDG